VPELILALAVSGCCHNPTESPPPAVPFVPVPTEAARAGFEQVKKDLQGDEVDGDKSPIGQPLSMTLRDQGTQHPFAEQQAEFIQKLRCRKRGCYAELIVDKPEKAVRINQFVTDSRTPLNRWSGWRFVSGLYDVPAAGQTTGYSARQRRMAVVVLAGAPFEVRR
jgi:hypothetical protein